MIHESSFWDRVLDWFGTLFRKIFAALTSRKFWAAIAATILILQGGGTPEEIANQIAAVWIAYILGTALEDGLSRR